MFRSKSWFGGIWKPKNPHSLEHLKYLYNVLSKNQTVSENNKSLLVETLRSIAEILIWGDQNDSTVFDFFLEKNMLSFFLKIMKQKCGSFVCVQLLQTLNILFENIRNETSLYYLLSNNHVNSIIVHKFDFSDEEVMAYYISFLKTLSLKLNSHTIHFFYNEHTNDFPLYTEAIKFFNNSESMVRIAVRTLTLNVYKVEDKSMLKFIRDKTAAPYFSNLVWFIGNHVLELDSCIRENSGSNEIRPRLADLVAEHLDHLHYLNDILLLEIDDLNEVLTDHLIHRLLIPLYISSLDNNFVPKEGKTNSSLRISKILSLFLLSQIFLIINHSPLVRVLARIILNGNKDVFRLQPENINSSMYTSSFENNEDSISLREETSPEERTESLNNVVKETLNCSDLSNRPFLASLIDSLDTTENDYAALFSLCLFLSFYQNKGINKEILNYYNVPNDFTSNEEEPENSQRNTTKYNEHLLKSLIAIISQTVKLDSKVRVVTLKLVISLLKTVIFDDNDSNFLNEKYLETINGARDENILLLQNYYKHDELFLEIFEDEYFDMSETKDLSVEHLLMDSNLLLPPVGSPLTGISFDKRLPCGEVERSRRSMRIYFILRKFSLALKKETEKYLPLINTQSCVRLEEDLDLNNSDLLSCTVITRDNIKIRRFLVLDYFQLILVEPSQKRSGWGIAKFVGFLQDIEVLGDKSDSRVLHITVKSSPTSQRSSQSKTPILSAKFLFEDYIRCMAAKQKLQKGKYKARERKLHYIAKLLNITGSPPSPTQNLRKQTRRVFRNDRSQFYSPISKTLPGLAMAVVNEKSEGGRRKSRDPSPSVSKVQNNPTTEEIIPLGKLGNLNNAMSSTNHIGQSHQSPNLTLNLKEPNCKVNSSGENTVNSDTLTSPSSVTTPQSETSFMISKNEPFDQEPSVPNSQQVSSSNHSSNSKSPYGRKKKKGAIETV